MAQTTCTSTPLDDLIKAQGYAILDGGLATELENRGTKLDTILWSAALLVNDPAAIQKVHYDVRFYNYNCLIVFEL